MNFSPLPLMVVVLVPCLLTLAIWRLSRGQAGWQAVGASFFLGGLAVWPVIRVSNWVEDQVVGWADHYYLARLVEEILATALPEELGKGLAALLVLRFAGARFSPLGWLGCLAAAHAGFAAVEGMFSALGNEGNLKVLIGRTFGAISHASWGIMAGWFLWRGWSGEGRRSLHYGAAVLIPVLLHAVGNASLVEVPGAVNSVENATPPLSEVLIVLSGMGSLILTAALAAVCLGQARRWRSRTLDEGGELEEAVSPRLSKVSAASITSIQTA